MGERRIAARRRAVAQELQGALKLPPVRLKKTGNRGHDSNYIVSTKDGIVGILRLVNPHRHRPSPPASSPMALPAAAERLQHEWQCLAAGAAAGLTPKPLWRADDALLCAYLPYKSLQEKFERRKESGWELAAAACRRIAALHALGVTHMDMSMSNVLASADGNHLAFIDFEYGPAPGLPVAAQRLFDHLRLIESIWKFLPAETRGDFAPWLNAFAAVVDDDMRAVDLSRLAPALSRIFADERFKAALDSVLRRAAAA